MSDLLEAGCELGRYRIVRALRQDSTGVEYEASVSGLGERVVLREYLPVGLVERSGSLLLKARPGVSKAAVDGGLALFLARYLALQHIDHPAIVGVKACLRANGTAYAVLEYARGQALSTRLAGGQTLLPGELAEILTPLLDGLEKIHHANVFHWAIELGNIVVCSDGIPILVGFGSRTPGGPSSLLSTVEHPVGGYAAPEQYSHEDSWGPWTDIYGLAAVAYRCVSGVTPLDASERLVGDHLMPAVKAAKEGHGRQTLAAIDHALALRVAERPATISDWQAAMGGLGDTGVRGLNSVMRVARQFRQWRRFFSQRP